VVMRSYRIIARSLTIKLGAVGSLSCLAKVDGVVVMRSYRIIARSLTIKLGAVGSPSCLAKVLFV
jgi:hypothetical protein